MSDQPVIPSTDDIDPTDFDTGIDVIAPDVVVDATDVAGASEGVDAYGRPDDEEAVAEVQEEATP